MLVIQFISAATALTAIGWGFGYLVGKGIVWYRHRRKVVKWLEAERAYWVWRAIQRRRITPMPPKIDEYYERQERERARRWAKRGALAESIVNSPKAAALLRDKVDEIVLFQNTDITPVSGHTDPITKELVHIYRQPVDRGDRYHGWYRFSEYRGGMFIRSWDAIDRMPPPPIEWEKR